MQNIGIDECVNVPYDSNVGCMKKLLFNILSFAREAFPYILIFYLVLFLLENLFPGFVSNNFNLNWILAAVFMAGLLAVFAPDVTKKAPEKPAGKNEYLLVAVLGLVGGAIILAKMEGGTIIRWATAAVSSILIAGMGLVTLSEDEREPEEFDDVPTEERRSVTQHVSWQQALGTLRRALRPVLLRRVELPFAYVLLFVLFTAFLIPKNMTLITNSLRLPAPAQIAQTPEPLSDTAPFYWDDLNEFVQIPPSEKLHIWVLNGGGERGTAATFSAVLKDNGFGNVETGNADRYDYTNAQIRFAETGKPQAMIIKHLLREMYPLVLELPAEATSSGITVILGAKDTSGETPAPTP